MALAVYNEAKNFQACLGSVKDFADEIIVVDGGSVDETVKIAKTYGATVIRTDNPPIFHINKQKAFDACHGAWILQLDADEVVTNELKKEIISVINEERLNHPSINGYYIPRRNYFWGHFMKKGGQYPDYVIRLVRKGYAKFPCTSVHEQITIDGDVGYLKNPMDHFSYRTKEDYWKKADAYTTLTSEEMKQSHIPKTCTSWITYSFLKPVKTFLSLYVRHKGFMDGWYGLVFAYWSALHHSIAYKKYLLST